MLPTAGRLSSVAKAAATSAAAGGRAVAATKGGRTVVDSGRQLGRNLADLARSSIAIAPAPQPTPNGSRPAEEVRGEDTGLPLTASDPSRPEPPPETPATPATSAPPQPAPATEPVSIAAGTAAAAAAAAAARPAPARGRAVPSSNRAAASMAASRRTAAPLSRPPEPSDEFELIVPSTGGQRLRLYPPWWRRIASFVVLGLLTLLFGLAAGTAIGALIAFLYRIVQSSL